jgi:hypothetical protein
MIHHGLKLKRIHLSPYNILCVDDEDFIQMEKNLGILKWELQNFLFMPNYEFHNFADSYLQHTNFN